MRTIKMRIIIALFKRYGWTYFVGLNMSVAWAIRLFIIMSCITLYYS